MSQPGRGADAANPEQPASTSEVARRGLTMLHTAAPDAGEAQLPLDDALLALEDALERLSAS